MSDYFYRPSEGHGLAHDPFNAIVAPRPIGWISSLSQNGIPNLAPYSFFNAFGYVPPLIGFSSVGRKDSLENIEATEEFVWNLASRQLATQMNLSCSSVGPEVDEFDLAGLTTAACQEVSVPRVGEALVALECRLAQIVELRTASGAASGNWLVTGEVVGVHIDESLLEEGVYNTLKGDPILRGGGPGDYFTLSDAQRFVMLRP